MHRGLTQSGERAPTPGGVGAIAGLNPGGSLATGGVVYRVTRFHPSRRRRGLRLGSQGRSSSPCPANRGFGQNGYYGTSADRRSPQGPLGGHTVAQPGAMSGSSDEGQLAEEPRVGRLAVVLAVADRGNAPPMDGDVFLPGGSIGAGLDAWTLADVARAALSLPANSHRLSPVYCEGPSPLYLTRWAVGAAPTGGRKGKDRGK
jgi:hypothetical protein